jgi:hypothetical protein
MINANLATKGWVRRGCGGGGTPAWGHRPHIPVVLTLSLTAINEHLVRKKNAVFGGPLQNDQLSLMG